MSKVRKLLSKYFSFFGLVPGCLIVLAIAIVGSIIIGMVASSKTGGYYCAYFARDNLCAFSDSNQIRGHGHGFFLSYSEDIEMNTYYYYYVETGNGSKQLQKVIVDENVYINDSLAEGEQPYVETAVMKWHYYLFGRERFEQYEYGYVETTFYLPKGSIIEQYSIDME